MDFALSEEQTAVRQLAAQILGNEVDADYLKTVEDSGRRFDPALWRKLADAGLLGVAVDEAHGGSGFDFVTLCLLIEEVGRTLAPVPVIPALAAGLCLQDFGSEPQRAEWLPQLVNGRALLTTALSEPGGADPLRPRTALRRDGEAWFLHGSKDMTVLGDSAEAVLLAADCAGEPALLLARTDATGIDITAQDSTTGEPQHRLDFVAVRIRDDDIVARGADAHCALQSLVQHSLVASACMLLGATDAMLGMTARYTAERQQFGRPIATFQAVSHRAADAWMDVEHLRLACQHAASRLAGKRDATEAVTIAKVWACDVAHRVSHSAQHLHGGIGVDRDYPLFRYCLWAKQLELFLGGGAPYLARLGDAIAEQFKAGAASSGRSRDAA